MLLHKLPRRALLAITGTDARLFLDALITCGTTYLRKDPTLAYTGTATTSMGDFDATTLKHCVYGVLLTETGRVMYDIFLHAGTPLIERQVGRDGVLLECSQRAVEHLSIVLRRSIQHADVQVNSVPKGTFAVAATFAEDHADLHVDDETLANAGLSRDPRLPLAAGRGIVPAHHLDSAESFLDSTGYRAWRYAQGLPCGPLEMRPGVITPVASNVANHIGCLRKPTKYSYPGAEAVADEIARESTREGFLNSKRVVPVRINGLGANGAMGGDDLVIERGAGARANLAGRLIAADEGRGLALMRVRDAIRASAQGSTPLHSVVGAKVRWSDADASVAYEVVPSIPSWWPEVPKE